MNTAAYSTFTKLIIGDAGPVYDPMAVLPTDLRVSVGSRDDGRIFAVTPPFSDLIAVGAEKSLNQNLAKMVAKGYATSAAVNGPKILRTHVLLIARMIGCTLWELEMAHWPVHVWVMPLVSSTPLRIEKNLDVSSHVFPWDWGALYNKESYEYYQKGPF